MCRCGARGGWLPHSRAAASTTLQLRALRPTSPVHGLVPHCAAGEPGSHVHRPPGCSTPSSATSQLMLDPFHPLVLFHTLVQENLGVMSIGFMLPNPDDAVIWRGPRKNGLIKQ